MPRHSVTFLNLSFGYTLSVQLIRWNVIQYENVNASLQHERKLELKQNIYN